MPYILHPVFGLACRALVLELVKRSELYCGNTSLLRTVFLEGYDDTVHVAAHGHLLKCYDHFISISVSGLGAMNFIAHMGSETESRFGTHTMVGQM